MLHRIMLQVFSTHQAKKTVPDQLPARDAPGQFPAKDASWGTLRVGVDNDGYYRLDRRIVEKQSQTQQYRKSIMPEVGN